MSEQDRLAATEGGPDEVWRNVRMSTALFMELGASRVDWGEPDGDGFYTPTLTAAQGVTVGLDMDRLAAALWTLMKRDGLMVIGNAGNYPPNLLAAAIARAYAATPKTAEEEPCYCGRERDAGCHDTPEECDATRGPCLDWAGHHPYQPLAATPQPAEEEGR